MTCSCHQVGTQDEEDELVMNAKKSFCGEFSRYRNGAYSRMEGNSDGRTRVENNLDGRTSVVDQSYYYLFYYYY